MKLDQALRARLERAGQEHLLDHCSTLDDAALGDLVAQLERLEWERVGALRNGEGLAAAPAGALEPVAAVPASARGPESAAAARGRAELAAGRVAFVLLAGGQGSRLRWEGPKGTFPIGPRTERSLYRILVEKLRRGGRDHGVLPRLAVTTSRPTDAATRAFFERKDCFGYDRARLTFVAQPSLPVLDADGRLLLASPARVFCSPDGHGGAVHALVAEGLLDRWAKSGVTTVCTLQVDNPLLDVVDADLIGRVHPRAAPIATKVVRKEEPDERVGIVARRGGRPVLIEYSELPAELAAEREASGALRYRAGSIGVHAFAIDFLRDALAGGLPLHAARREIPPLGDGEARRPAIKYERFLFDLFPRAPDVVAVEAEREREFAPLKHADDIEPVRAALDREYRRWYREAAAEPPAERPLELSPLDVAGPDDLLAC